MQLQGWSRHLPVVFDVDTTPTETGTEHLAFCLACHSRVNLCVVCRAHPVYLLWK